jgi:hypothetical protein
MADSLPTCAVLLSVALSIDEEVVAAADAGFTHRGLAEAVGQHRTFGSQRLVFEAEFGSGLVDGAFGVSEVGVGAHAVGRGAEGAAVVVWGDVVAVAVGLDGRDSTFPGCAGDVVLGAGAEDGGDVGGGLDLGCDNELALGVPVARAELFFECA